MPLVTAAVLAYCAGLLAGFGNALFWTVGAAAVIVWRGGRTTRDRVALGVFTIAAYVTAASSRASDRLCLQRLLQHRSWDVTLAADAEPGAFVAASHACGVRFRIAVSHGHAAAESRVSLQGSAVQARDAIMVTGARVRVLHRPGVLARWRARIGRGLDARFGSDAPLVRALLIADMADLSPTVRDRFSAAGLSHMLSVSGLHVGLIAVAVSLLAQIAGVPARRAGALVVGLTAAYVIAIGAPLPAVRAAIMLGISAASLAMQRPTSAWAILAVGAMAPFISPRAVLDVGFQLSVVGIVALVSAGAFSKRFERLSVGGWQGTLYRSLVASTAATLLTAPLVAATFGRVSFVAPVSNLIAVPIMAVLQPMLFLAALLLPLGPAAQFVADACHPLMAAVDTIASLAARLPGASISVVTDSTTMALACAAATAFVIAAVSRFPWRAILAGVAALALIAWRPLVHAPASRTELHMIDVGQGDALALRTTKGRWVLFDAGRDWQNGDAGKRDVVPYIAERGGDVVAFVLSHPHSDHVGGAASTLRALRPAWYFDPAYVGTSPPYRSSLLAAAEARTRWRRVRPGDSLVVDEAVITFLAPDSAWADTLRDPNDASAVARIRIDGVTFLITGDAEADEERWMVANQRALLRADVLKVAHHGSRTSSIPEFLDVVQPRLALVSVGAGNVYRHPSPSVMQALAERGIPTLRTDLHGTVVVRTDGRAIEVAAGGEIWPLKQR